MKEIYIKKDNNSDMFFKYDEEQYDIEYAREQHMIILRRLSDKQILTVFDDNIGFIAQHDEGESTHFVVSGYVPGKDGRDSGNILAHFYVDEWDKELNLRDQFRIDSKHYEDCHIKGNSYIIENSYGGGVIYNLKGRSKRYSHIYNDDKLKPYLDSNTILVQEELTPAYNHHVNDTITYGINPETFEITTSIWSELQQRYINVYTEDQLMKLVEKGITSKYVIDNLDAGEITITLEIEDTLDGLAEHIPEPQSVYLDKRDSKINEEFVKRFGKKQ